MALTNILIAGLLAGGAFAGNELPHKLVVAQTSRGGPEQLPPSVAPTPPSSSPPPRTDYIPPSLAPNPPPQNAPPLNAPREASKDPWWGAIAFTADGSYSSAWKAFSQPEAEVKVLKQCAGFGRGRCEVVSFSGQDCVGLATFIGGYRRRRWNLSFTAGGLTYPDAQAAAMGRCNSDERTQGRCQLRTAACADGR
jgi:hypothetical protein